RDASARPDPLGERLERAVLLRAEQLVGIAIAGPALACASDDRARELPAEALRLDVVEVPASGPVLLRLGEEREDALLLLRIERPKTVPRDQLGVDETLKDDERADGETACQDIETFGGEVASERGTHGFDRHQHLGCDGIAPPFLGRT